MTSSAPHALQMVTQAYHDWHLHIRSAIQFVELYHRGVPNSPRGAPQGARFPQRILLGGSNIARVFCAGVPWTGEAKFPMAPVWRDKHDQLASTYSVYSTVGSQLFSVYTGRQEPNIENQLLTQWCTVDCQHKSSQCISCCGSYFLV